MQEFGTKIDNVSTLTAAEFNNYIDELENVMKDLNITLNASNLHQIGESMSTYAAVGDFYVDSGSANAYVLGSISSRRVPVAYTDSMRVRFKVGTSNTGASTVNVSSLGVKNIKNRFGEALEGGELVLNQYVELTFDNTNDYFFISNSYQGSDTKELIQDYTVVSSVGSVGQQYAGHYWALNELSVGTDIALYLMTTGGSETVDQTGTYNLTNNGTVSVDNGILGSNYATRYNGTTQWLSHASLLDTTSGLTNGIGFECWFKADDGQPASEQFLIDKINNAGGGTEERMALSYDGTGFIKAYFYSAGSLNILYASTQLPNGITGWYHLVSNWDTTNGARLWVNGVLEAQNDSWTTIMANGTAADFTIGKNSNAASGYYDGAIGMVRIKDAKFTQKDIDLAYSTKYTISNGFSSLYKLDAFMKADNDSNYVRPYNMDKIIVAQNTSAFYRAGGLLSELNSTDSLRIEMRY